MDKGGVEKSESAGLDLLLDKVYQESGYDFREYKRGTVTRRLQRRLHATGTHTYSEYMRFLGSHPEEHHRLADDLTIKVSGFFRSPYTFQQVANIVLPDIVVEKRKRGESSLRIWSTACARGEEPYSIAILLAEYLGNSLHNFNISIHATDINEQALCEAQAVSHSPEQVKGLPDDIVARYFTRQGEGYAAGSLIRRMVSFSRFDLVSGTTPPFTALDCIFCCNILIYLQRVLQERVLSMLYNSLAVPGYLMLGEVETPTDGIRERLICLDAKAKIYKKSRRNEDA